MLARALSDGDGDGRGWAMGPTLPVHRSTNVVVVGGKSENGIPISSSSLLVSTTLFHKTPSAPSFRFFLFLFDA